jgi:hypothetical protein
MQGRETFCLKKPINIMAGNKVNGRWTASYSVYTLDLLGIKKDRIQCLYVYVRTQNFFEPKMCGI